MTDTARRIFIARILASGCAATAIPLVARAAPPHVEEDDETAVALGYRHESNKVDGTRYPNHRTQQRCANCSFFQGDESDEWAGCAMFGRKHIAAAGWCSAWNKKPG
jgi:hypothetical protein